MRIRRRGRLKAFPALIAPSSYLPITIGGGDIECYCTAHTFSGVVSMSHFITSTCYSNYTVTLPRGEKRKRETGVHRVQQQFPHFCLFTFIFFFFFFSLFSQEVHLDEGKQQGGSITRYGWLYSNVEEIIYESQELSMHSGKLPRNNT